MALADRDYMRGRRGGLRAPEGSSLHLIVLLVGCWVVQNFAGRWGGAPVLRWFALSADAVLAGKVWTLVTYALLHGSFSHLLWNCVALWIFGAIAERRLDPRDNVPFALWSAIAGGAAYLIGGLVTGTGGAVIGASGIVTSVVVFAALRSPWERMSLLFLPFVRIPLALVALVMIAGDVNGALGASGSGIAYWAHIGGAAYGVVAHRFGVVPRLRLPRLSRRGGGAARHPAAVRDTERLGRSADAQRRVDALLDKIGRDGIASLTDEERAFLNAASKHYR